MTPPPAPLDPNNDDDLLAAEFVLGLAEGGDYARAQGLLHTSPAFATAVAGWQARLAQLDDEITPVTPPDLLPQINARLFGAKARFTWPRLDWLHMPHGWLASLLGTGAMAALSVLAVALMLEWGGASIGTPPPLNTTLSATGSDVEYIAALQGAQLILTHTKGAPAPAGRSYELWIIDGDKPAQSLGIIQTELILPAPELAMGYTLAVTIEPFGGAPGGVATGPVIAAGMFAQN